MTKKFSQFVVGDIPQTTDIIVGLRAGDNTQFDFSGINDPFAHPIVSYEYYNEFARNYIRMINSPAGIPVVIQSQGIDANVGLVVSSKANGDLDLISPNAGNVNIIIGGAGDITMTTNAGKFIINETTGIDAVLDEDDMVSDSATAVPTQQSVKAYVDNTFALVDPTFVTNTDERYRLPNSQPLSILSTGFATVETATGIIGSRVHTGTANQITVTNGSGAAGNPIYSLPSTLIAPGTFQATTSINIGGAGATVTSISTDGTLAGNSDTLTVTQKAVKTYVDTAETATKSYSYITKTDNTANLPNSTPLSGLATGFLANTTATGVLTPRTMTGTTNQINVANGDGSGVPTFSLSSTLIAPGTLQATTSFNIGGSGATVTSISTDGTMAANSDALLSTQKAIKTYVDTTGGAAVTLTNAGIAGGTTSLVNDGTGPALAIKGLAGSTNISVTTNTTDTTIALTGTIPVANGGTGNTSVGAAGTFAYSDGSKYVFSGMAVPVTAGSAGNYWRSNGTDILSSAIQVADVPTLNQNTSGQAGSVANSLTINNSGTGSASGATYNGGSAITISYNTLGASPLAGSSSLTNTGTVTSGTWGASFGAVSGANLTNITAANISAGTAGINISGNAATATTATTATSVSNALTMNNSGTGDATGSTYNGSATKTISYNSIGASPLAGSSSIVTVGIVTTGTWNATAIGPSKGGTGLTSPGALGNVLTSDGAGNWLSSPPTGGGGLTFNAVSSSTQALAINNCYYTTYAGLNVMTLPAVAAVNSIIEIIAGPSGNTFKVAQNSGQMIYYAAQNGVSIVSQSGTAGYLQSSSPNTIVTLKCVVANTTWVVLYANNNNLFVNT